MEGSVIMVAGLEFTRTTPISLIFQRFTGLSPGIIKLTGLADNDGACSEDQYRFNIRYALAFSYLFLALEH